MSETIPEFSECAWPVDPACLTEEWDALDEDVQTRSLMLATATLRRLTGYRVGGCPVLVRPCKAGCSKGLLPLYVVGSAFRPHIDGMGSWVNSCGCLTDCSCSSMCEVALPGPVGEVYEVKLNGVVVDDEDYRVVGNSVVWVGEGECPWPTCQDMALPDSEDNTFSISYLNAYPVDAMGAYAVGVLALEFARACTRGKCRLPSGVTSIVRQGVSYEIATASFGDGFTGIREIDTYIALWNPNALKQPTGVWFPGMNSPRVSR